MPLILPQSIELRDPEDAERVRGPEERVEADWSLVRAFGIGSPHNSALEDRERGSDLMRAGVREMRMA